MIEAYQRMFSEYPLLFIAIVSIFGLLVGSFLNVVAIRVPKGESVVQPPSHCSSCKHRLAWRDLVPIWSYYGLKGRCRYCKALFSPKYAYYEALTGFMYGASAWYYGLNPELLMALLFVSILIVIVQTDLKEKLIPDRVIVFGLISCGLLRLWVHPEPLWQHAVGFLVGGGVLYLLAWFSEAILRKEGMGGGDIKLFAWIGLVLGFKLTLLTLFMASLLGTLFGLIQLIMGVYRRDRYIPFGPFIAVGAYVSYLWGNRLIQSYLSFFIN
ncbi:Type 4 prepilin-like proteins leader peptide-processing enzyme [compost metagenome]